MAYRRSAPLDRIEHKLDSLLYMVTLMSQEMDALKAAVAAQTSVVASVEAMLTDLAARLKQAVADDDPATISAIVADIEANTKHLADAVQANTATATSAADPSVAASDPPIVVDQDTAPTGSDQTQ